ncbi:hypothetical protein Bca52824_023789 [Brassica carinata]|uniref:peptidylprolyl isomerase n=1 Tax=Brassica carinata TaxID=52824 RepID=A0A8X8AUX2_BRACI|nr:hypothetical protein Bca52824_023789 [Brassica carinata]
MAEFRDVSMMALVEDENNKSRSLSTPAKRRRLDFGDDAAAFLKVGEEKEIQQVLKKKLVKEGEGFETPENADEVEVHYTVSLLDGTKFDSSRDRGTPFKFTLGQGQVIKGWDIGIKTMKKGENAVFTIPSALAYGESGSPPTIPANATLQFDVELLSWSSVKDICKDGGVFKKIVSAGGEAKLEDGTVVWKSDGVEFTVKDGYFCPALAKAVKTMKKAEKVLLTVKPQCKTIFLRICIFQWFWMKKKLNEWWSELLHGGNASSSQSPGISTQSTETVFYHMRPALSLKGFTSHQLRVIKLVLGKHFGDLVYIHANDKISCSQDFVVYTDSESDKENVMKEAKDERKRVAERKIQSAIGFRHVIDLLSSEKKLSVGHNSILDIAHVYIKFVGPLPSTAEGFVASIRDHFPYIVFFGKTMFLTSRILFETFKMGFRKIS